MKKAVEYNDSLINVTREELVKDLKERLSKKRFEHVLRVEETAIQLAKDNHLNPVHASIAALLHDYCKEMDKDEMFDLATKYFPYGKLETASDKIWHSYAAAWIAKQKFGIMNIDIIDAISAHTIGWFEMAPLVQVVFIADYIEPGRDFEGVEKVRALAEKNLEEATFAKLVQNMEDLLAKGQAIYPFSLAIYNHWIEKKRG